MPGREGNQKCGEDYEQGSAPQAAAEHYMVDFNKVERSFLSSEHQLLQAMLTLVDEAGLKLLSYHCGSFHPVYVAVDSTISTYHQATLWRASNAFVPRPARRTTRDSYKIRGFDHEPTDASELLLSTDLSNYILDDFSMERKEEVASFETEFQRIDIFDARFPCNGALGPKEKPLHNTIKEAVMIEIDEEMVTVSRDHLPEWSDCSDLVDSSPWCVNDPRATIYYEDALKWFMGRSSCHENALFDVIIMDGLDPESEAPIASALYGNDAFMKAFSNLLANDGILVMQLGEAPLGISPDETYSKFRNRATTTSFLENTGFEGIHIYEESHCGFAGSWAYVVGFKSADTEQRWYASAAAVDLDIQKRSASTKSGNSPFLCFDGPTRTSYQVPHHDTEAVFCRRRPMPKECLGTHQNFPSTTNSLTHAACGSATGEIEEHQSQENKTFKFNPVADRHRRREMSESILGIIAVIQSNASLVQRDITRTRRTFEWNV